MASITANLVQGRNPFSELFKSSQFPPLKVIDKLPLIPNALEFVGILSSTWFTYRYLSFKPVREELFQIIDKSLSDVLGQ